MFEKKKLGDEGFSIVEAMVAIVILSIIFIPITNTFISSIKASQETKIMQEATSTAQGVMEDFKEKSLIDLSSLYTVQGAVDITGDTWSSVKMTKEITRADNNCCDFKVEVMVSKTSSSDKTNGLDSINNVDIPQIVSMNSPASCVITAGEIPQWAIDYVATKAGASSTTVKNDMKREYKITLSTDPVTTNTYVKCEVNYYFNETVHSAPYLTDTIKDEVLSTQLENVFLYYTAGHQKKDYISFVNSEGLNGNLFIIADSTEHSVADLSLGAKDISNISDFKVSTTVKIEGTPHYDVTTDQKFMPDTKKETRRYEIAVTVKKKSNDKVYSSMVSTRGK